MCAFEFPMGAKVIPVGVGNDSDARMHDCAARPRNPALSTQTPERAGLVLPGEQLDEPDIDKLAAGAEHALSGGHRLQVLPVPANA